MKQGEVRVCKQGRISSPFWRTIHAENGGHLASVLLQVLLKPGPRMTPSALCLGEVAQWRMLRLVGCVLEGIRGTPACTSLHHKLLP